MVILVSFTKIPYWIPIVVLTREFAVSGYRLVASTKKGNVIAASYWGKVKTASQMVGIFFMFLTTASFFEFLIYPLRFFDFIANMLGSIFLLISVVATIISGYDYLKNIKDVI